jgi:CheY-like chemotaxis protein
MAISKANSLGTGAADGSGMTSEVREQAGRLPRTCLIVESDTEVRQTLAALVQELELETIEAAHALQAIAVLEDHEVGLILTHEHLPGPSGTMLLRLARYRWPRTARILVSSSLKPEVRRSAIDRGGAHGVVSERMPPSTLRDQVASALIQHSRSQL